MSSSVSSFPLLPSPDIAGAAQCCSEDGGTISEPQCSESEEDDNRDENRITRDVPRLLDQMNKASADLNVLETELRQREQIRQDLVAEWSGKKQDMLPSIGRHALEKSKPYYEALNDQRQCQCQVHIAGGEYGEAMTNWKAAKAALDDSESSMSVRSRLAPHIQTLLSDLMGHVQCTQRIRDNMEQVYMQKVAEFNCAQNLAQRLLKEIGSKTVDKCRIWYDAYSYYKQRSYEEAEACARVRARIRRAKGRYESAMTRLEEVSNAVHECRKQSPSKAAADGGGGTRMTSESPKADLDSECLKSSDTKPPADSGSAPE